MNIFKRSIIISIFLSFMCAVSASAQEKKSVGAQASKTRVTLKKVDLYSATNDVITTDAEADAFNVDVTLNRSGCLVVNCTIEVRVFDDDIDGNFQIDFDILIDGVDSENYAEWHQPSQSGVLEIVTLRTWRCSLSAGSHNVQVRFTNNDGGDRVQVVYRTLEVHYMK